MLPTAGNRVPSTESNRSPVMPPQALQTRPLEPSSYPSHLDDAVETFLAERPRLLRIAYGIVGNVAAAEDVVQETWLRWQRCDRGEINNPAAFLATATTRLAINVIQSAGH